MSECVLCGPRETSIYFSMPDLNLYDRQNLFFLPLRDESIKSECMRRTNKLSYDNRVCVKFMLAIIRLIPYINAANS